MDNAEFEWYLAPWSGAFALVLEDVQQFMSTSIAQGLKKIIFIGFIEKSLILKKSSSNSVKEPLTPSPRLNLLSSYNPPRIMTMDMILILDTNNIPLYEISNSISPSPSTGS